MTNMKKQLVNNYLFYNYDIEIIDEDNVNNFL